MITRLSELSTPRLEKWLDELRNGQNNTEERPAELSRLQELVHELQVHQLELELQNRELRQARKQLEETRDHYADLYDYAPIGYMDFDIQGRVVMANITAMCMLGRQRSNLIEKPFTSYLDPVEIPAFFHHLRRVLHYGDRENCQLRLGGRARGDATVRLESIAVIDDRNDSGPICRSAMLDVTNQMRAEAALRQQQDALTHAERLSQLGELASGIAHELNQPLASLLTYAQTGRRMLERGAAEPRQLGELLDKMAAQAELGGNILGRVRRFARKTQMTPKRIQLNEIVVDAVALTEARCRERNIKLLRNFSTGLPAVMADPVEIQQVVMNLITNGIEAIDATGARTGSIEVITRWAKGRHALECCVADTGTGPDSEQVRHLFQPFFTTKREGMGLGLSISHSILERHGGELCYAGHEQGRTLFCFTLAVSNANDESGEN